MKLQKGDVVVQSLRIVVVMDVSGGHAQRLGARRAELLGEVVVTNANVNGVSSSDNALNKRKSNIN